MSDVRPAAVVVLAAGEGTRMKSATPKVLHDLGGRCLLAHALAAAAPLQAEQTLVVVGSGRDQVEPALATIDEAAKPVLQERQQGTGHAVRVALDAAGTLRDDAVVVVLPGDAPLLRPETLQGLLDTHADHGAAATLLTAELADPFGYGRVVRDHSGSVAAVVEERDADADTRRITEVATSVYAFAHGPLRRALDRLTTDNAQGEEYLPDVVRLLVADGLPVVPFPAADPVETLGVNDRVQLAAARRELRDRLLRYWMTEGVTVVDPASTWVDVDVQLDGDVTLQPNTQLHGRTRVHRGATVGPNSTLTDTLVGPGAAVTASTCNRADIGEDASVGPYAFLRPGTRLGPRAKVGAYCETKNTVVGADSKVPHLSYVGDATIGERSNVGAATVFVNYDGREKHHSTVGDDVRIGSDTMLVAPVEIGDGAYTAAGSVITQDVPAGALGVGRARQRNIEGWVARRRGPSVPAEGASTS